MLLGQSSSPHSMGNRYVGGGGRLYACNCACARAALSAKPVHALTGARSNSEINYAAKENIRTDGELVDREVYS